MIIEPKVLHAESPTFAGVFHIVIACEQGRDIVIVSGFGPSKDVVAQVPKRYAGALVEHVASHPYMECVVRYVHGERDALLRVPYSEEGTDFEQKVWRELRAIPFGTTITYQALAERVGNPRAVRAVANACGKNRLMLFIPCHRVVRADGGVGGYRYGTKRKQKLIAHESKMLDLSN